MCSIQWIESCSLISEYLLGGRDGIMLMNLIVMHCFELLVAPHYLSCMYSGVYKEKDDLKELV